MFVIKKSISSVLILTTFLSTTSAFAMDPELDQDKKPSAVRTRTAAPKQEGSWWGTLVWGGIAALAVYDVAANGEKGFVAGLARGLVKKEDTINANASAHSNVAAVMEASAPSLADIGSDDVNDVASNVSEAVRQQNLENTNKLIQAAEERRAAFEAAFEASSNNEY